VSVIVRFRVPSLLRPLCLLLGFLASVAVASGQHRVAATPAPRSASTASAQTPIATTLALNLCVDGTTQYPCPTPITSDDTYIPAITLTYGQILDGVVVYGPPTLDTGVITIFQDTTPVCTLRIGIDTMCPADSTIFDAGNYTISATLTFPAGSDYTGSSAEPVTVMVQKDTSSLALTSSQRIAPLGTAVTFTATATGGYPATPTGQIVFSVDQVPLPAVALDVAGRAGFTTTTLGLGLHTITAAYAGGTDFLPAADVTIQQQIVPPASVTTLSSNLNPSIIGENVTFTASVATAAGSPGTPGGIVTFKDGTASFGTVALAAKGTQNIAQAAISTLTAGTHSITATYSGDGTTSASLSQILTQQVDYPLTMATPGYTITVTPSPVSVGVGLTANLVVTVAPISGFSEPVTLSCSNLPTESACTFDEPVIPAGGGSTMLQLSTMAPHDCGSEIPYFTGMAHLGPCSRMPSGMPSRLPSRMPSRALRYGGAALAGGLLLLLPHRRRINRLFLLIAMGALCSLNGCGSHCTDFGTIPGSYTFKVNGTAPGAGPTPVTAGSESAGTVNVTTSVGLVVKL